MIKIYLHTLVSDYYYFIIALNIVFPSMSLFFNISGRTPGQKGSSDYTDICPQSALDQTVQRLTYRRVAWLGQIELADPPIVVPAKRRPAKRPSRQISFR